MAKVRSAGGNCLSGSILEQLEHVFREATNDYSFISCGQGKELFWIFILPCGQVRRTGKRAC